MNALPTDKYRWLAWNPLWVLIALAWLVLVGWALQGRMAEKELGRRQAPEKTQVTPAVTPVESR
ncbi:MAG: hypothetical protein M3Y59_10195 [Myxococcota bacterium]|nr:hypothetical protein [Myxococcota bacterium]